MADLKPSKVVEKEKFEQRQKSSPSGATTHLEERESKFDEEGGDQPQAASERESDEALKASDAGRNRTHTSGAEHDDRNQVPVGGQHNQQNPQLTHRK